MLASFFFKTLLFLFRLLPFWLLYLLSDSIAFLLYRIIKYRYKVIQTNLKNAFPAKTEQELEPIIKGVYQNLSDILLEAIKGLSMSQKEMQKRYKLINPELLDPFYKKGISVLLAAAHYGNWEWVIGHQKIYQHNAAILYKPLKNKDIDKVLLKGREHLGLHLRSISDTRTMMTEFGQTPSLYIFIADQTPSNLVKADWVTFLNQDTPCLQGLDRQARHYQLPVFYSRVERVKRGFYEVTLEPLHLRPQETEKGAITRLYMQALEKQIREKPSDWLWSHKRWKHSRPKVQSK